MKQTNQLLGHDKTPAETGEPSTYPTPAGDASTLEELADEQGASSDSDAS